MRDLGRLLRPRSIVVVGGGAWGRAVIEQSRRMGFEGKVYCVHPSAQEVEGVPCVPRVADLPEAPDAAFVGVNRSLTIEAVEGLARIGCGGAVCFASGFSEAVEEAADGVDLQAKLVSNAGEMPILGPNCYGFVNALDGALLWPDQHGCKRVERGVAILTQSSNIAINLTMQRRALPVAYMITCGNMAQTRQAVIAHALLDDPRVTAIGVHVEGFGDTGEWYAMAQAAQAKGVPVIALKVGRSAQARQAAVSHTASLAGEDAGAQALLDHLGIARVDDLPTFLETLKLWHMTGGLHAPTLSAISCSGGEASLAADTVMATRMTFPPLKEAQKQSLKGALGPMVALANPLDYHTYIWRDTAAMTAAWRPMADAHIGMTMIIVDYPHTDARDWCCATEAAIAVRTASGRPVAVVSTLPELMPDDVAETLTAGGVVPMSGLREAILAADIVAHPNTPAAEAPTRPGGPREAMTLTEAEAKQALAAFGLDVPRSKTCGKDAVCVDDLRPPLAIKGLGVAHKTEAGAVALNVDAANAGSVAASMPGDAVLIEEMITGAVAELLVGVTRDPAHGFVLTLGTGGVLTELWADTVSLLLPVRDSAVEKALNRLKTAPLLAGYRGKPSAELAAILRAVMTIQAYVLEHRDRIEEVEVNPLVCTPDAAVAVDALIRMAPERN